MLLQAFKVMEAIEIVTHSYLNTEQIEARKLIYSDIITNVLQVTMCWRLSERSLYFFLFPSEGVLIFMISNKRSNICINIPVSKLSLLLIRSNAQAHHLMCISFNK